MFVTGCIDQKGPGTSLESKDNPQDQVLFSVPEEYIIYQDYLQIIGGKPGRVYDQGVIEATVLSISETVICPYNEENCSIEPYPKDMGVVKIDKIISYIPYSEISEKTSEQPSSDTVSSEVNISSGNKGIDYPSKPKLEYLPLKEGQEVKSLFVLTARPAKARYYSHKEVSKSNTRSAQILEENTTINQSLINDSNILKKYKDFKPIPSEGNYFIFTTKIGESFEKNETVIQGLEVGSKLRAEIYYDGLIYIKEYGVIN